MDGTLIQDLLLILSKNGCLISNEASELLNQPHQKIVGAIKSLESLGNVVEVQQLNEKIWVCTEEGEKLAIEGSHEARLFNFITLNGESISNIKQNFPSSAVALGAALKNKWVRKDGDKVFRSVESIEDKVQSDLLSIKNGIPSAVDDKSKADYKKRKLIKEIDSTKFEVKKGNNFSTSVSKQEAELTKDMIESGQWKTKSFKPFNFNAKGKLEQRAGHLHPLMQLRGEFRSIFLEMGFSEMPTNNYIESAFWNFDALFQPQQHPARDAQDTFYISDPEKTISVPLDYLEKVKDVHSKGGFGSIGYRSPWSFEESQKNLLRTHTTAVSARLLQRLAQDGFKPVKYFSVDKVYRNETLDATHLAEFHQVEGVIADYNLSIKHLMGIFTAFFEKIGIRKIRFKPCYNPYTEPSMEIYSYHEGLEKWVEVGNSGYFRPEMLRPMGLPENVTVAGWGLSLERPAMIMYGINNIRELVGPRVKMELILDNPVCTIDKFKDSLLPTSEYSPANSVEDLCYRQTGVISKLKKLEAEAINLASKRGLNLKYCSNECQNPGTDNIPVPSDIVIYADPARPPYSLGPLIVLLADIVSLSINIHTHSSIDTNKVSNNNSNFWSKLKKKVGTQENNKHIHITLVWKSQKETTGFHHPSLAVNPMASVKVIGEVNLARYLCRLIESQRKSNAKILYEMGGSDIALVESIDQHLDICHILLSTRNAKETATFLLSLNKILQKNIFICGKFVTVADLVLLSTLKQLKLMNNVTAASNVEKWLKTCSKDPLASLILEEENHHSTTQ